ncbi:unnamed protein product, partial [Prorocentrum cordatum]
AHEGRTGCVVTCLLDRRRPRQQTISYLLDGEDLGVAFRLPPWMAEVALLPAVCGREGWRVAVRGGGLRFPPPPPYRPLEELLPQDGAQDEAAELARARALFAPAPAEDARDLRRLDVPGESLVELASTGDETLDRDQLERWLREDCELPAGSWHLELSESGHSGVVAFADHRAARGALSEPPPMAAARRREDFSEAAEEILLALRPEERGGTSDKVARRFIAGPARTAQPCATKQNRKKQPPALCPRSGCGCAGPQWVQLRVSLQRGSLSGPGPELALLACMLRVPRVFGALTFLPLPEGQLGLDVLTMSCQVAARSGSARWRTRSGLPANEGEPAPRARAPPPPAEPPAVFASPAAATSRQPVELEQDSAAALGGRAGSEEAPSGKPSGGAPAGAEQPPRGAAREQGPGEEAPDDRWQALQAEVASLARSLAALKDVRGMQQEYLQLLRAGC